MCAATLSEVPVVSIRPPRSFSLSCLLRVIVNRLHHSIVGVLADQLVKHLDVVKHVPTFCVVFGGRQPFDLISFEKVDEVFGACVFMTIPEPVDAGNQILFAEK